MSKKTPFLDILRLHLALVNKQIVQIPIDIVVSIMQMELFNNSVRD